MCKICDEEYVKRIRDLRPFLIKDYDLLKNRVSPACERCFNFIGKEIKLLGGTPNMVQIYRHYKHIDSAAKLRLNKLDTEIRTGAIRAASAGSTDPGIFFPRVPTTPP